MRQLILVRYGEIYLKGLNRPYFMRALVSRVKQAVRPFGSRVWLHDARIFISDMNDMDGCMQAVSKVFGVHSLCPAVEMEKGDFNAICDQAVRMMQGLRGSFKVEARRADKRYPMTSPEINMQMGGYILERCPDLHVDIHTPEHVMNVEIRDMAYLYVRVLEAVGGMPVGTGGKAMLLLSGGIDSPVAGYMIAKRGVQLHCIHYHSFPFTSEQAKQKVIDLARLLSAYAGPIRLHIVPFTEIQQELYQKCPDSQLTVLMRRFMMRIAERVARRTRCQALVTGESIGQVASQTMDGLTCTNAVCSLPVFRPLIGFDKTEIMDYAERIGTYETSILPYEDCCTIFTPRHPQTKPRVDQLEQSETLLDGEALIERALTGIEVVDIRP